MKRKLLVPALLALALATGLHAAVPTEISGAVTDQTSVFTDVKTYVIGVVVFLNLIAVIKMLRKK